MERFGKIGVYGVWLAMVWMLCNLRCTSAWSWLMLGNWSSTNFTLPCNATYCVNLPIANPSMPFQLHRCKGVSFCEEQFSYDGAKFVMSTSKGVEFCLDTVGRNGTEAGLRPCDAASQTQRWLFNGTKLRNGQGAFLMAPAPLTPYASDLAVIVGELYDSASSDWTLMESSNLGTPTAAFPSSRSANLVANDQFLENWGGIQPEGSWGDLTLLCGWTILGDSKTSLVRDTLPGRTVSWNVLLGAISQIVPTYPGLPHSLRFNVRVNSTCEPAPENLLVSLTPSSSESNTVSVGRNGGLWKAEEIRFVAVDSTVNLTFASVGGDSGCSVVIGNVEVGLEDDYLVSETAGKLWKRVVCLYALAGLVGTVTLAVSVAHVVGSLRSRNFAR